MNNNKNNEQQQQQQLYPIDMSTKVGGRIFHPALPVVDGNGPSESELGFQQTLDEYVTANIPTEDVDGIQRRERVLNNMGVVCRDWIRNVCIKRGLLKDVIDNAGGQLFTSGSYRLGVHEPGADIDTILVAPSMCRRQDFFGTNPTQPTGGSDDKDNNNDNNDQQQPIRDPDSLAERIRRHPDVTNFNPVEGAAVPLLTFDWEGVNIDLLFARHNSNSVMTTDFDIDNDTVLDGADTATEKSLNGPRVTNLIAAFVSGTKQRYQNFLQVVRCVRKWAKARGLYSNKMGYFGGVNINIGVALTIQLYPNACAASLLRKFFLVFKTWRWPQPMMLTKPHDAGFGLQVWSPQQQSHHHHHHSHSVAPMITPAYPAMNSTLSISRQTLQILQEEFNRGHDIVDQLWKEYQQQEQEQHDGNDGNENLKKEENHDDDEEKKKKKLDWSRLFEKSDFFISFPTYLSFCIVGPSQEEAQAWCGFVESRLRKLVSDYLGRSLPLKKIQLWPKKLEVCIADKTAALLTQNQRQNSISYFIGYQVDHYRMRGDSLNIEHSLQNFREWELTRYNSHKVGMDVLVKSFRVKELPKICFIDIYGNNTTTTDTTDDGNQNKVVVVDAKLIAMKKRRQIRNDDPHRQEKRRLIKIEQLKAKMAEIQKKKQQEQQQQQEIEENKKRKREDDEEEKDNNTEEKQEEEKNGKDVNDANGSKDPASASAPVKVEETEDDDAGVDNDSKTGAIVKIEEDDKDSATAAVAAATTIAAAGDSTTDETNLLESALDAVGVAKTRQQAEDDRRKLLAGEMMLVDDDDNEDNDKKDGTKRRKRRRRSSSIKDNSKEGEEKEEDNDDDDDESSEEEDESDDDDVIYTGDDIRDVLVNSNQSTTKKRKKKKKAMVKRESDDDDNNAANEEDDDDDGEDHGEGGEKKKKKKKKKGMQHKDKRSLPIDEKDAALLRKLGYAVVSDDETKILGTDLLPPWKQQQQSSSSSSSSANSENENDGSDTKTNQRHRYRIKFLTEFPDLVELDANGHVVDKGDDDYKPSKKWNGRMPGFEFKLGERGLGYYRTGKKVVVPSNTAY